MKRTEVLIVDDSATVRQALRAVIEKTRDMAVQDTAMDPIFAMAKMNKRWPDVIVLDLEMPRMDGLAFLRQVMATRPTPVVICSSLTSRGTETAMQAMAAGAMAVFSKEDLGIGSDATKGDALVLAIREAAGARIARRPGVDPSPSALVPPVREAAPTLSVTTDRLVAIGTSTGGTQALEFILQRLPRTCPGLVVVQHMPPLFTTAFAQRLDKLCEVEVLEAQGGERIIPGRVLIAPGGRHLVIKRDGATYVSAILDAPPVNRHAPSVDVLFRSVARHAGRNATGFLLTGMGDDGARGLLELRTAGARTYAQDEASSVVFGMPKEGIALGGAEQVIALDRVPRAICQAAGP
ncbi:MAG: chemotaxis response regulator protein-glutamate methylesterase [Myxococcaceae bacterium]